MCFRNLACCDYVALVFGAIGRDEEDWVPDTLTFSPAGAEMCCEDDEKPEKSVEIDPEVASTDSPDSSGSSFSGQTMQTVPWFDSWTERLQLHITTLLINLIYIDICFYHVLEAVHVFVNEIQECARGWCLPKRSRSKSPLRSGSTRATKWWPATVAVEWWLHSPGCASVTRVPNMISKLAERTKMPRRFRNIKHMQRKPKIKHITSMCPRPLTKCFSGTPQSWAFLVGSGCRRSWIASPPWWSTFQIRNACNRNATSFQYALQKPLGITWIFQSSNHACWLPCDLYFQQLGIPTMNWLVIGCWAL